MSPFIGPAIGGLASGLGGFLAGQGQSGESKMQRTQRKLVDQLISSLSGNGPFSSLYNSDENAFQKSFVEPAQAMFRNQIAPQIQQQYIQSGQQRGTGLDDTLTRAGVDLDALLNQHMYQFQQDALNRKQNTIGSILGAGSGAPNSTSGGQDIMSGLGGFLTSTGFSNNIADIFKKKTTADNQVPQRKGFEPN